MAAIMGLTQAVVRSLSDVTELPARRWELPMLRWMDGEHRDGREIGDRAGSLTDLAKRFRAQRGRGRNACW